MNWHDWKITEDELPPVDVEVLTVEKDFVVSRTCFGGPQDWRFHGWIHPRTGKTIAPIFSHWRLCHHEGECPTQIEADALRKQITEEQNR